MLFRRILVRYIPMILWQLGLLLLLLLLAEVLKILILLIIIEPLIGYLCIRLYRHLKILIRLYIFLLFGFLRNLNFLSNLHLLGDLNH